MEVSSGGEEKQGKGEKNGWWRRKAGEERKGIQDLIAGVMNAGF